MNRMLLMRTTLVPLLFVVALLSCGQKGPVIDFGVAECAHCRMNVVDRQYGAALITLKGRQYVFDDIACLVHFVERGTVAEDQVASWYVCDHAHPGVLIDASKALYLHGTAFRSPMRGDVAAFGAVEDRDRALTKGAAETMEWEGVRALLKH